ncbi:MAG TPA: 2-amino-4-hydroxy-6-hydroxymethyldihydropteridine diphosphokinase [Actinobacteria bacterium]|nr:2-amino-4-hydroxy-6-hydroxymethyldihydropteridine diphosphokinase [Actinomycetota bacterium]
MPRVYLSLGSNIGDRKAYLRAAIKILEAHGGIDLIKISSVYETEPEGYVNQRKFYNIVTEIEANLSPAELLGVCHFIEDILGRKRQVKWGPRVIDVDILLYGEEEVREPGIIIPHPEVLKRAFILVPLLEISPEKRTPSGVPIREFLDESLSQRAIRIGNLKD